MTAILRSPLFAAVLAVLLSVGVSLAWMWRALEPVVQKLAAARPPRAEVELKRRGWDFWTIEIENLSNELKDERARLQKQADTLDQRAARLDAEEKELAKIRADLDGVRKEISSRVIEITADEAKNIRSLAMTYTNLSARAAVAIFREMDDATAVKILSVMKPDVVGPIFEEMSRPNTADPQLARRAAILSEKLRLMKSTKAATTPS